MKRRNLLSAVLNTLACIAWGVAFVLTPKQDGAPMYYIVVIALFAAAATFFWVAYVRERKSAQATVGEL